jgi:hypothetical protein
MQDWRELHGPGSVPAFPGNLGQRLFALKVGSLGTRRH